MTLVEAVLFGLVQGLTEFFPISSSGHLALLSALFGVTPSLPFEAVLHLATLAAVCMALRKDVFDILQSRGRPDTVSGRLGSVIVLATLPVLLVGFLLHEQIAFLSTKPLVIIAALVIGALLLFLADRFSRGRMMEASSAQELLSWKKGLLVGCAQLFAFIPGLSRSGITITAGRVAGFSREFATRFSFLLSIPATAAAGAFGLFQLWRAPTEVQLLPLLVAFISAFLSGWFAIRFLLRLLRTQSFLPFVIYRILLAGFLLTFLFSFPSLSCCAGP